MNITRERRAIEEALDTYRKLLDTYTDEVFIATPPMGGWSYAEVYDHIMKASLASAIALERCTHNNCLPTKDGLNFWGYYILYLGTFPPFKVKVPEAVAAKMATQKINKEDARNLIIKVRKRIEDTAHLVADALPGARWKHPRMGMLNAGQWLQFIRIHLEHHIKQLQRIKNNFSKI